MTTVVNFKQEPCDVKITRKPDGTIPLVTPGPGYFGNPYKVEKYGREECIRLYREYFYDRIERDPVFKEEILKLKDKILGCFCKPLACHGDIIKEYLDGENFE